MIVDQAEQDLQVFVDKPVIILLAGELDDLDDLEHQCFRPVPTDFTINLLSPFDGLVVVSLVVDVQQDAADLVGLPFVRDIPIHILDYLVVRVEVSPDII